MPANDPSTLSAVQQHIEKSQRVIAAVRGGTEELRNGTTEFLPQYGAEHDDDYDARLSRPTLTNILEDALQTAISRPFGKRLTIAEGVPDILVNDRSGWDKDIDLQGNSLHSFARRAFEDGLADGLVHILVDHLPTEEAKRSQMKSALVRVPI